MQENIDLKQIEKKAFATYFADGLWELFVGSAFLLISLNRLFRDLFDYEFYNPGMTAIFVVLGILVLRRVRTKVTYPRIGYVNLGNVRSGRKTAFAIILALAVLLLAGLIFAFNSNMIRDWYIDTVPLNVRMYIGDVTGIVFAFFIAVIISFVGIANRINRLHITSVSLVFFFMLFYFLHVDLMYGFLPVSIITLTIGIVTMIRFVRTYPVLQKESVDDFGHE